MNIFNSYKIDKIAPQWNCTRRKVYTVVEPTYAGSRTDGGTSRQILPISNFSFLHLQRNKWKKINERDVNKTGFMPCDYTQSRHRNLKAALTRRQKNGICEEMKPYVDENICTTIPLGGKIGIESLVQ